MMQTALESRRRESRQMQLKRAKQCILLVEDYEDNRVMLKQLLELSGYRVIEATNGEQAIRLAELTVPDLILMDVSLPRVDGLSATKQIRAIAALRDIPVVAVSAHDSPDFHARARASGCNEYVTKPIDFGLLESVISRLLKAN